MRIPLKKTTLLALGSMFVAGSLAGSAVARADQPPAAVGLDAAAQAKTAVCTDGKSRYIAIAPHERKLAQVWYGDAKTLTMVAEDANSGVPGTEFLDPRFPNPTANPDFRGVDWRNYSSVDYDSSKKTCALRCGDKTQTLTVLSAPDAKAYLGGAKYQPSPRTREPYALARDDHGTYYYVDRGNTPATAQNYAVWVGRKGAMKLQKMKDVAADSEGEVYSTATGDLRFITERDVKSYTWVHGKEKLTLRALPVVANLTLIYNTLGVYAGQRIGTPCDDF